MLVTESRKLPMMKYLSP
uniref:Uncharacterized protein n=1 Tax=Rhizophora mucronata TaxID=61149 RepID=A0A2P2QXJ5_RHIMU